MGTFVVQRCARAKILPGKQVFGNSVEHLSAWYLLPGVQWWPINHGELRGWELIFGARFLGFNLLKAFLFRFSCIFQKYRLENVAYGSVLQVAWLQAEKRKSHCAPTCHMTEESGGQEKPFLEFPGLRDEGEERRWHFTFNCVCLDGMGPTKFRLFCLQPGKFYQTYLLHYGNKQEALISNAKLSLISVHGPGLCPISLDHGIRL